MSKVTITSIFEISKALATKSGQELAAPLEFLADFGEQALRALRRGINFRDNFDGEFKTVDLIHNTEQIVSVAKTPVDLWVTRTFTTSNFMTSFGWYINEDSQLVVKAQFLNTPTDAITTRIAIVF